MNYKYKKCLLVLIGLCLAYASAWSQIELSNGTMSGPDIEDAVVLCDKTTLEVPAFKGAGNTTMGNCIDAETNSIWLSWISNTNGGQITFTITPKNPNVNIDFALYETSNPRVITSGESDPKKCSTSTCTGSTGLRENAAAAEENQFTCNTTTSNGFLSPELQFRGKAYALLIHSTSDDNAFTIEFGGNVVFSGPQPKIESTPLNTACFGKVVNYFTPNFVDKSNVIQYEWNFGEGATPSDTILLADAPIVVDYATIGKKTVSLTVETALGCRVATEYTMDIQSCCGENGMRADNKVTVASTNVEPVSCPQDKNGSIAIAVNSLLPHTVLWSNGATEELLTDLGSDIYKVVVTNEAQCKDSLEVELALPDAIQLKKIPDILDNDCSDTKGVIVRLEPSGGRTPYNFNFAADLSEDFTTVDSMLLKQGTHIVSVKDNSGCIITDTFEIEPITLALVSSNRKNAPCKDSTGSVEIAVDLGTAPYRYAYNFETGNAGNGIGNEGDVSILSSLPVGENYTITVTDANQCTGTVEVSIEEPEAILPSIFSDDILCFGDTTGAIIVNVTGGTPLYSYVWSNGATSASLDRVGAGAYTLTVTDANGCTGVSNEEQIEELDPLTVTFEQIDIQCNTGTSDNGRLNLFIEGGVGPYEFSVNGNPFQKILDNGNTFELFQANRDTLELNKLAAGDYSIIIKDSFGCILADTVKTTFKSPPMPTATDSTTLATCGGGRDGSIIINAEGGLAPYTYEFAGVSNSFSATNSIGRIDTLPIGDYRAIVTDANGCTFPITGIEVAELDLIIDTTITKDLACFGDNSGAIEITLNPNTQGQGPYLYDLFDGRGPLGDTILNNLAAGDYTIDVYDANNCQGTTPVSANISQPDSIISIIEPIRLSCFGDTNGVTTVSASGGTGDFIYEWSNGATTKLVTNLGAEASYTVTITDQNGCKQEASVNVNPPDPLLISNINPVAENCPDNLDGAINFNIEGGVAPYQYSLDSGATYEDLNILDGLGILPDLTASDYTIMIRDAEGCRLDTMATVDSALEIAVSALSEGCHGGETSFVDFSTSSNGEIISWTWDFGAGASQATATGPGPHLITYTTLGMPEVSLNLETSSGCIVPITVNGIANPASFIIEPCCDINGISDLRTTVDSTSCADTDDGAISLEAATVPTAPIRNIAWSNGENTEVINNLAAGVYTVTVTNDATCKDSLTVSVNAPPVLSINTTKVDPSCGGGADGLITIVGNGGTGTYLYSFDKVNFIAEATADNLSEDTYQVIIQDAKGCQKQDTVILAEKELETEGAILTMPSCFGGSDGQISLVPTNGTAPYQYNLNGGGFEAAAVLTNLEAGSYNIEVMDAELCKGSKNVIITEPEQVAVNLQGNTISCFGEEDGVLLSTASGGVAPFTYIWRSETNEVVSTEPNATNLPKGNYFVTVTDNNDCTASEMGLVVEPPQLSAIVSNTQNIFCFGQNNGAITLEGVGGTPPYSYSRDGVLFLPTATLSNLAPGTYTPVVKDDRGCEADANASIEEPEEFSLVVSNDQTVSLGSEIELEALVSATEGVTYEWKASADSLSCYDCPNPRLKPSRSGTYEVTATNQGNCSVTETINVLVSLDRPIYIPNAFSPNGDGVNDKFYIEGGPSVKIIKRLSIFNRFGAMVYDRSNISPGDPIAGWNGQFNGSKADVGIYVVRAEIEFVDNELVTYIEDVFLAKR